MPKLGWSRSYCNQQLVRTKRVFKWAVAEEYVPAEVYTAYPKSAIVCCGRAAARLPQPSKKLFGRFASCSAGTRSRFDWGLRERFWSTASNSDPMSN
jgi:hypothetical protein